MAPLSLSSQAAIAVRSVLVLLYLVVGLRLLGKRQLGQMNIYDLALILALANSVQNAMTEGRGNLSVGIISAGALLVTGRAIAALFRRNPRLYERLAGTPTVLLLNGRLFRDRMQREQITEEQVLAALRIHGLADPGEAKLVVLEVDGSLSVVPRGSTHPGKPAAAGEPPA